MSAVVLDKIATLAGDSLSDSFLVDYATAGARLRGRLVIASSGFSALVLELKIAGHRREEFGSDNNHRLRETAFVLC